MSNINFYISLLKEYSNSSIILLNILTYQQIYRIISTIKVEWQLQMFLEQLPLIKQFYVCVNQQYKFTSDSSKKYILMYINIENIFVALYFQQLQLEKKSIVVLYHPKCSHRLRLFLATICYIFFPKTVI